MYVLCNRIYLASMLRYFYVYILSMCVSLDLCVNMSILTLFEYYMFLRVSPYIYIYMVVLYKFVNRNIILVFVEIFNKCQGAKYILCFNYLNIYCIYKWSVVQYISITVSTEFFYQVFLYIEFITYMICNVFRFFIWCNIFIYLICLFHFNFLCDFTSLYINIVFWLNKLWIFHRNMYMVYYKKTEL